MSRGWARRLAGRRRLIVAVVVGVLVGLVGVRLLHNPARPTTGAQGPTVGQGPTGSTPGAPAPGTDPSTSALLSLVVRQPDVASSFRVTVLPGGNGLSLPTLDLCNGTFPSESRRTARLQDSVLDDQGGQTLSTEAVLYRDPAAAAQALAELKDVATACPATAVASPVGEPTVITRFNAPPDRSWPQTATVNRAAFDFTAIDATGQTSHSVAVYLQRGRALLGVYFSQPDEPQGAVAGQTTLSGIVGVFAGRVAALPASVVGS